jgi:transposase
MRLHANAPLGPKGRLTMVLRIVEQEWSLAAAAAAAGVSERTCAKWVARYRAEGDAGLLDRSSAPRSIPHRTSDELVEAIVLLRRLRMTGAEIAFCLAMALSTVSAVLARVGLGKLSRLEPPAPPNRYERRHPGELLHVDVKKLGRIPTGRAGHRVHGQRGLQHSPRKDGKRIVGWEFVHVCVDDSTRLAYVEVLPDEEGRHRGRLSVPRDRVLPPTRHPRRARDERQRRLLPLDHPHLRLPRTRRPPPPDPPLPPPHQRQGRTLHPDPARRLGLRRDLRLKPRTHRSP